MAITINPLSVVIEPTDQPTVFRLTCDVTRVGSGHVSHVTVKINSNMTKAELKDVIRAAQDKKVNPIIDADAYKIGFLTTLDEIMVEPEPIPEPPQEG